MVSQIKSRKYSRPQAIVSNVQVKILLKGSTWLNEKVVHDLVENFSGVIGTEPRSLLSK